MKNFIKLIGIVALVATIGFSVVSCGGEKCPGGCGHSRPPLGDTCPYISCEYTEDGCTCNNEGRRN